MINGNSLFWDPYDQVYAVFSQSDKYGGITYPTFTEYFDDDDAEFYAPIPIAYRLDFSV